jgi:hypothetical protein
MEVIYTGCGNRMEVYGCNLAGDVGAIRNPKPSKIAVREQVLVFLW